jgi:hypothetical protein
LTCPGHSFLHLFMRNTVYLSLEFCSFERRNDEIKISLPHLEALDIMDNSPINDPPFCAPNLRRVSTGFRSPEGLARAQNMINASAGSLELVRWHFYPIECMWCYLHI